MGANFRTNFCLKKYVSPVVAVFTQLFNGFKSSFQVLVILIVLVLALVTTNKNSNTVLYLMFSSRIHFLLYNIKLYSLKLCCFQVFRLCYSCSVDKNFSLEKHTFLMVFQKFSCVNNHSFQISVSGSSCMAPS